MLRTNLSTRPFYNERAVHLLIALVATIVLALTIWNVATVVRLSTHNTELAGRIGADRSEAERLGREATRIRRGIDQAELEVVVAAAREANTLIDRRTFSWTAFFNYIESTLPADVMVTSVKPSVDDQGTRVSMIVVGRRTEDVDEFLGKLDATGAFTNVLLRQDEETDEGLHRAVIDARYTPPSQPAATPASEAGVGR